MAENLADEELEELVERVQEADRDVSDRHWAVAGAVANATEYVTRERLLDAPEDAVEAIAEALLDGFQAGEELAANVGPDPDEYPTGVTDL